MGLTAGSVGRNAEGQQSFAERKEPSDRIIALAGNPNVGKSTVFNALTGLHQHTGNWPGKTVALAQGRYEYKGYGYVLVDLPGTYSLLSSSEEERIASDFIQSGQTDCTVVVCDATCLERNLNLVLQIAELTDSVVLCLNLLDEAERKRIEVDIPRLERELGIPVIGTAAGKEKGLEDLQECIRNVADGFLRPRPLHCSDGVQKQPLGAEKDAEASARPFVRTAERIAKACVRSDHRSRSDPEQRIDRILTGRWTGIPIVMLLLFGVFWLTIRGANYPSELLQMGFDALERLLWRLCGAIRLPAVVSRPLVEGIYRTTARVVAVMLPPVAIFFPLFTFLEDVGYLPRVAFLLDRSFSKCGSCGKQALTVCMGFGCNAAGVVGCRIIDSPRERLIGILTNSFVPCNGRIPALVALSTLLFPALGGDFLAALTLTACVLLGILLTLAVSAILSRTAVKGVSSSFVLELPPFRMPNFGRILVRSLLDRTLFVLGRAAAVAAPMGLLLWCMGNVRIGEVSLMQHAASFLEPAGAWLGMNGVILLAFVLAFPANELVLPVAAMALTGATGLPVGETGVESLFLSVGWSGRTALCMMLFFLFHWPCSTTVLTVYKETGKVKWTLLSILLPTLVGILLCRLAAIL